MTTKELLYVEDALGHESDMQNTCTQLSSQIQNSDLKTFVDSMAKKHGESFLQFYALLNG